jgi:hypothetical protein
MAARVVSLMAVRSKKPSSAKMQVFAFPAFRQPWIAKKRVVKNYAKLP